MRRRSSILTILWPFFPGALLVTASCGDFQDPASGSQGTTLSHPSVSQAPQQQIDGSESQLTPPPPANAVDPASLPISTGTAPASTETFGAGPRSDTFAGEFPAEQFSPPPHSETTQLSAGGQDNLPPWLSRDGPQPESVTWENQPRTKSVTFGWDPSPSGNATGYKVYVTTVPDSTQYVYDVSSETQIKATLLIGKSYKFTVVAYNAAGESPPASDLYFDLF